MAKYFLGSVGRAEAFRMTEDGGLELAFVSTTLTDSGLNIQTTKDDIRAGQGAPIQFSFYHDPSVEITLTDVVWKKEYVEAQLGARFAKDGTQKDFKVATVKFDENGVSTDFTDKVFELNINCPGVEKLAVWGAKQGTDDWKLLTFNGSAESTGTITLPAEYIDGKEQTWCVRYYGIESRAAVAEISTQIIPQELYLIITAPLFAGDSCAASKGKAAGHITFDVPRFQLNGAQEFQMNMSSNQTMSLSGIALASPSLDCTNNAGKLLNIREVIDNEDYTANIVDLVSDEETEQVGKTPIVYGIVDGKPIRVKNADLEFLVTSTVEEETPTSAVETVNNALVYKAPAGSVTIRLKSKPTITQVVTVQAA